ncbi:DUF6660 family protein [Chishuiella sp.]|uniref:DUF6660 family protein n=1 Tax=Chishuiella sp. TaxID=1969467 RepID=UPI0028A72AE0|nr:DUF6660 family protein [Chishuiella sp.]
MKLIIFILSIYMLALSLSPCNDAYKEFNRNSTKEQSKVDEIKSQDIHEDFCSPFCSCSCCGTVARTDFNFNSIEIKEPKFQITDKLKFPLIDTDLYSHFYGNIWQPPKI